MKLLVDSKLRENLITRGKSRLKELSNPIKLAKLNKIFDDYKIKAQTWSLLEEH
jgi:hypothetical protein